MNTSPHTHHEVETAEGWRPTLLNLMAAHQRDPQEAAQRTRIVVEGCVARARRARGAVEFELDVCDLSLHGIGFETTEPLSAGQHLVVRFNEASAAAAWLIETRWTADLPSGRYRVGAEIVERTNWDS